jgi:translation elongation factor EF-G
MQANVVLCNVNLDWLLLLICVTCMQVPLSEMFNYVGTLRSMTKGRGSYIMQLGDYEQMPPKLQEEVVAANKVTA